MYVEDGLGGGGWHPPKFCHKCGHPYPWTEAGLTAARALVSELDGLSDEEKARLESSIEQLARETPEAHLAALRVKKIVSKLGSCAAEALRGCAILS